MASMDDLRGNSQTLETGAQEKVAEAQERRQEIDEAKKMYGSVLGLDLDDEIKLATEKGIESARLEATGDIKGVKGEVDSINSQIEQVKGEIQAKIAVKEIEEMREEILKDVQMPPDDEILPTPEAIREMQQKRDKLLQALQQNMEKMQQAIDEANRAIEQDLSGS